MGIAPGLHAPELPLATKSIVAEGAARASWASAALLLALWFLVWNQQRLEWTVNPTYAYGWAVPLLAGYLFWERWRSRPLDRGAIDRRAGAGMWLVVPALLLAAYLPVRVVQEANPDWVKINVIMAALVVGLSFVAVWALAGWRGMSYCAFPILFCFTAVPWPVWIEDNLTKSLMHWNAIAGAEVLTLAGHPTLAQGSLLQIGTTWVNVEEACSGIRSLQTAFMASLFFGEFHRLSVLPRVVLVLASLAVAFAVNFGRTVTLTLIGGTGGADAMDRWHDTVGNVAMVLCLLTLWLLAELARRRNEPGGPPVRPVAAPRAPLPPFPFWFAVAGLGWLVVSETATAGWYRYHEHRAEAPVAWSVRWPREQPGFRFGELGERSRALLKFNDGGLASWRSDDGLRWQMYYLHWEAGRVSKFLAGGHYPTVCLPATGLRLVENSGVFRCELGALTLPLATYLFDDRGTPVYVFHAILEDGPRGEAERVEYRQAKSSERIASVLRGERNLGQRVIGLAISGPLDLAEAQAAAESALRNIVTVAPVTGASLPLRKS